MLQRTVSLYSLADGGDPVPRGTGVLLQIADDAFLVSAGHVLDIAPDLLLFVGTGAAERPISLHGHRAQVSRDVERVDYGFVKLTREAAGTLQRHKQFLRLDELDLRRDPEPGMYCLVGFPQQYVTRDRPNRTMTSGVFRYASMLHDGALDNFAPGTSLAISCQPEWHRDLDGGRARVPQLKGISGCGIWRAVGADEIAGRTRWDPSSTRLVGIEHTVVTNKAIVGVLVYHLIHGIWHAHPELRRAIELARV